MKGVSPTPSAIARSVSSVFSSIPSAGWAMKENRPGSWVSSAPALVLVAMPGSTRFFSSRPILSSERMLASIVRGAQSGCAAAGMW